MSKQSLAAKYLADVLVEWGGGRIPEGDAVDLANRYLSGEKSSCMAWRVFASAEQATETK